MTGNYATTVPWYKQATVQKTTKKKAKKTIIHQIFHDCVVVIDDDFWKDMFIKMSMNKFPGGFRISDQNLVCHDRNKSNYVNLTGTLSEIASSCIEFLKKKANILSSTDKRELREAQLIIHKSANQPRSWDDIKSKRGERRAAIIQYISGLTRRYQLNDASFTHLLTLVNVNFYLGKIINTDITYENGCITNINGLIRIDGVFVLDQTHQSKQCKYRDKDVQSINLEKKRACSLSSSWAKYAASKTGMTKAKALREITIASEHVDGVF